MTDHGTGYGQYDAAPSREPWADSPVKRQLSVLRRHLRISLILFVIVVTLGLLRAYRAVPIYEGVAKIMIERQAPRATEFQDVVQPNISWWGKEYYRTQEQLARSRAVLEIALEDEDVAEVFQSSNTGEPARKSLPGRLKDTFASLLGIPPNTPPETWERLRGMVSAKHMADTHFMLVRADSSNPQRAAKIANAVAEAFITYHMRRRLEISNDVFLYLQEQKIQEEQALLDAEAKLQQFREQTSISSLDASDSEHPVLKRLSLLNEQLTTTELQRIDLESEYRFVKKALERGAQRLAAGDDQLFSLPSLRDDESATQLREALIKAEEDLAMVSDVYGPAHPRYKSAERRVTMWRERLASSLEELAATLEARLEMVADKEMKLKAETEDQNDLAMDLAKQSLTFKHLENSVERHRRLFEVLVERMSEVELTSDYTRTNVEVVEHAGLPKRPARPNKRRMAMSSIILGLALAIGLAFVMEHVDDTVRTPEDMELRVGIPVLGFVPQIEVDKEVESKTSYRSLICALEPTSSAIEAYRNIRTGLFFSVPAEEAKVLLVSSAGPGDGKSTTATNLALIIAQSGKRVLLVDSDFRRPMLQKCFGLDQTVGFSSVLVGEASFDEAVQKSAEVLDVIESLDLMPTGPKPANPTELLESASMKRFLEAAREKYDRIIIDTPPILFVSDAAILSAVVDGVILVVRADKCTGAHAARARKQIEKVSGRIIGGILNNVRVSKIGHYYSDYFYYGYARYHRDYYGAYYSREDDDEAASKKRAVAKS